MRLHMFLFRETVDIVYLKYFFSFLERENWSRNIPRAKKKWGREFLGRGKSHPELLAFMLRSSFLLFKPRSPRPCLAAELRCAASSLFSASSELSSS